MWHRDQTNLRNPLVITTTPETVSLEATALTTACEPKKAWARTGSLWMPWPSVMNCWSLMNRTCTHHVRKDIGRADRYISWGYRRGRSRARRCKRRPCRRGKEQRCGRGTSTFLPCKLGARVSRAWRQSLMMMNYCIKAERLRG